MSGKDETIFSKEALINTDAGRDIIKHTILKSKQYKQFSYYKDKADSKIKLLIDKFVEEIYDQIFRDVEPYKTLEKFVKEVGNEELLLDKSRIVEVRERLLNKDILKDRVSRIINSNFVKMTYPVFMALVDGADSYLELRLSEEEKDELIDAHIIAIDLSEPMDRIIDKDEDIEYLEDYKFMNPYILTIAREKISRFGSSVYNTFEKGFIEANEGQNMDRFLKFNIGSINYETMDLCYKKYRATMGTAGKNMALSINPLGEIFYYGMAKAAESVGCGNEMEDSLKGGSLKVPSWPLYFTLLTKDANTAFNLTLKRSYIYLDEARLALDMLPNEFQTKPFLEFLFLTVKHYNEYWYSKIIKSDTSIFNKSLDF